MKFNLDISERQARLILTFIRRSTFEQFERNMSEAGFTVQENKNISYETIDAFCCVRDSLSEKLNKG